MPQLVKGGKWVFGWVVASRKGAIRLPPAAQEEYGFRAGAKLVILPGSRRSGGFALAAPAQLDEAFGDRGMVMRILGESALQQGGRVALPPALGITAGSRLLVMRGSGRALGFAARGPIYEKALGHGELQTFE